MDYLKRNWATLASLVVAILSGGRAIMENLQAVITYLGDNIWTVISIASFTVFGVLQIWARVLDARKLAEERHRALEEKDRALEERCRALEQRLEAEVRAMQTRMINRDMSVSLHSLRRTEKLFDAVQEIREHLGLPLLDEKDL